MKKNLKYLILLFLISGGIVGGLIYLPREPNSKNQVIFNVKKGEGSKEIALKLDQEDLIWWGPAFRAYVLLKGISKKLQAGYYFLSPGMNIPEIAKKFASGETIKIKITIPEGWTAKQIVQKIPWCQKMPGCDIGIFEKHEGYLFPDTYLIDYGTSEEKIVKMMVDNFKKKTAGLEVTSEVVIMASLLEKEVKTKEEKRLAAGVLWKRLEVGMPLQVDAEMWTYENLGLPPKPISNPGLESILAALSPKSSPYWYYLSKPDGKTIFQKTLKEHNIAKAKYLK